MAIKSALLLLQSSFEPFIQKSFLPCSLHQVSVRNVRMGMWHTKYMFLFLSNFSLIIRVLIPWRSGPQSPIVGLQYGSGQPSLTWLTHLFWTVVCFLCQAALMGCCLFTARSWWSCFLDILTEMALHQDYIWFVSLGLSNLWDWLLCWSYSLAQIKP